MCPCAQAHTHACTHTYLLCIRRRHCGGHVTCPHGPPHQVCSIAEVVDGEHAARVAAVSPGDVRGLPIVAVHDVGLYIVGVEVVQSGAAVELKPAGGEGKEDGTSAWKGKGRAAVELRHAGGGRQD
eukprot:scaffold79301_cov23-Tisochrysis_lutea.AAC.1